MPKITFGKLDEIPEALRGTAKDVGGKFEIDVVATSQFEEVRTANTQVSQERDQLKSRVAAYAKIVGDDPTKAESEIAELRRTNQLVQDGKLKGSDAVEQEVQRRLADVKTNYETQLRDVAQKATQNEQALQTERTKRRNMIVDQHIRDVVYAEKSGANPQALPDILSRARDLYTVDEHDRLVAKKGDSIIYGKDGVTPLPANEWLGKLLDDAPYLRLPSAGGGGNPRPNTPHGMTDEAFQKLSPEQRIALARKASAGK
jgi:hypothetical protein